jgi:molybdopterin-binding protein
MPRLPQPGSDAGNWGNLLNDFLTTTHDSNGNLKVGSVTSAAIAADSVTLAKLAIGNAPSLGQVLSYDGASLLWATANGSGAAPDATTTTKGLVQLTGDLSGTAAAPTVPGLATKANTADVVSITDAQTVTGSKNFTGGLQSNGVSVVATSDARLTNFRTPVDGSVSTIKVVDNAITEPKLSASNVPTSGQLLSYNGTDFTWVAQPTGTATDPTMGGSLTGTASNAQIVPNAVTVTELSTNAVVTVKIADANVTTAKIADSAITEPKLAVSNIPTIGQVLS